jgi:hypothetical protein
VATVYGNCLEKSLVEIDSDRQALDAASESASTTMAKRKSKLFSYHASNKSAKITVRILDSLLVSGNLVKYAEHNYSFPRLRVMIDIEGPLS